MLNESYILKVISPYLNSKRELSEFEFCELFADLQRVEQYEVIQIMIKHDIDYVEEKEAEPRHFIDSSKYQAPTQSTYNKELINLTNEQLCLLYQKGDAAAISALIEKNSRFVYKLANKIHHQFRNISLSVDDLYAEGNLGLMKAAQEFDAALDYKFLTYCWHWIRQSMSRAAMDTGYIIRLPVHIFESLNKINDFRKKFPKATVSELCVLINNDSSSNQILSDEKLQLLLSYSEQYLNTLSLDMPVGEDGSATLADFYVTNDSLSVEDVVFLESRIEEISAALKTLSSREEQVINLRFGLDGYAPMTLEEVGSIFNVTRERIRQIETKALRKLKHPTRRKRLESYWKET